MKTNILLILSLIAIFFAVQASALTEKIVLTGMNSPWAVVTAPDGTIWITEKTSGDISIYNAQFQLQKKIKGPTNMVSKAEGGLMDLAFHPQFKQNKFIYLSYTVKKDKDFHTQVGRFKFTGEGLTEQKILVEGPGSPSGYHFGSRLLFDDKGFLLAAMGDRTEREKVQDIKQLHGKILRMTDDGGIPSDNPFGKSLVYSTGHRNPQGLAIHPVSRKLYASEHGPSIFDGPTGGDEINEIVAGQNYGWPKFHHRENGPGMTAPLLEYTPTLAPSGIHFYTGEAIPQWKNDLFVAGLKGQQLARIRLDKDGRVTQNESLLKNTYGRLRDVATSTDGSLLVLTDDGRLVQLK